MLRDSNHNYKCIKDGDYYRIPLTAILEILNEMSKKQELTTEEMHQKHLLHDLFIGKSNYPFENNFYKIPKYGCEIVECFAELKITEDMIAVACYRAKYENRKELYHRLKKIFNEMHELCLNDESLQGVYDKIRQNDSLFEYITKYATFQEYLNRKTSGKVLDVNGVKHKKDHQKIKTDNIISLTEKRNGDIRESA